MIALASFIILVTLPYVSPNHWPLLMLSCLFPMGLILNKSWGEIGHIDKEVYKNGKTLLVNSVLVIVVFGLIVLSFLTGKTSIDKSNLGTWINKVKNFYDIFFFYLFLFCFYIKMLSKRSKK